MLQNLGKPFNAHIHDEVIASVAIEKAYDFAFFIVAALEQRREIPMGSGNYLTVPAEITVGRTWGDPEGVEFATLPRRGEFCETLAKSGFKM